MSTEAVHSSLSNDASTKYLQDDLDMEIGLSLELPDPLTELRQTFADQTRGEPPSTVMGVLLESGRPTTPESVAGRLGKSIAQVEWTLEILQKENLVVTFDKDSVQYALAFSEYT